MEVGNSCSSGYVFTLLLLRDSKLLSGLVAKKPFFMHVAKRLWAPPEIYSSISRYSLVSQRKQWTGICVLTQTLYAGLLRGRIPTFSFLSRDIEPTQLMF